MVRRAELRRNLWTFSIRTVCIRAIDIDTMIVTFGTFNIGTTYVQNDVAVGSDGQIYYSLAGSNTGNDPTATVGFWRLYFGSTVASQYVSAFSATTNYAKNTVAFGSNGTAYISLVNNNYGNDPTVAPAAWNSGTTYYQGNFTTGSDANIYQSVASANTNHNPVGDGGVHWTLLVAAADGSIGWDVSTDANADTTFYAGELVYSGTTVYQSTINNNAVTPIGDTTGSWRTFTTAPTIAAFAFIYPIGCGPESDQTTRNAFMLPNGFLREAPQAPKAGINAFLGGPSGLAYNDWELENGFLTSMNDNLILFRFGCDVEDPLEFDPLFAEGFSCRIALEICEPLTQSGDKLKNIGAEYKKFMGEARTCNGIETGYVEPPVDEYIAVRV